MSNEVEELWLIGVLVSPAVQGREEGGLDNVGPALTTDCHCFSEQLRSIGQWETNRRN